MLKFFIFVYTIVWLILGKMCGSGRPVHVCYWSYGANTGSFYMARLSKPPSYRPLANRIKNLLCGLKPCCGRESLCGSEIPRATLSGVILLVGSPMAVRSRGRALTKSNPNKTSMVEQHSSWVDEGCRAPSRLDSMPLDPDPDLSRIV